MGKIWLARTKAPSADNKYYIMDDYGGYNKCRSGNGSKKSVLPNCTGFAYGRFMEIGGKISGVYSCSLPTNNAEDWYASCSAYEKGQEPKLGAVICFSKGKTWTPSDGCGHVAIVEGINADGSLDCTESNWSGGVFAKRTIKKVNGTYYLGSAYKFQGFIYNPWADKNYKIIADEPIVTPVAKPTTDSVLGAKGYLEQGDSSAAIDTICRFMANCFYGYYYTSSKKAHKALDGPKFGPNLLKMIKKFQTNTGLEVDGNIGPITLAELKKYGLKL